MRKVNLIMDENQKYITIKKLVETNGNKKRAALYLNCSVRHINRMIKGYEQEGKAYFIHSNRGRKPAHTLDANTKQLILDLYRTKYADANITHFSELLISYENIKVSPNCIRDILFREYILSPKARRVTKKNVAAHLLELKKLQNLKKRPKRSLML